MKAKNYENEWGFQLTKNLRTKNNKNQELTNQEQQKGL